MINDSSKVKYPKKRELKADLLAKKDIDISI
jgi:hypothetical protein